VGVDPLMVFADSSPITVNHVGFTSVTATNDEWLVPDEFISGPGKLLLSFYFILFYYFIIIVKFSHTVLAYIVTISGSC